jgi:hypothetical protein
MSRENVDPAGIDESENVRLARSVWEAWERGDFRSVDWADPEVEFVLADLPGAGAHVGVGAMNEAWREFLSSWDGFHVRADEYRELADRRVLVLATFGGRGKQSGVDVGRSEFKGVMAFDFQDRKVTRMVMYYNRDRGLAELGIAPGPGHDVA